MAVGLLFLSWPNKCVQTVWKCNYNLFIKRCFYFDSNMSNVVGSPTQFSYRFSNAWNKQLYSIIDNSIIENCQNTFYAFCWIPANSYCTFCSPKTLKLSLLGFARALKIFNVSSVYLAGVSQMVLGLFAWGLLLNPNHIPSGLACTAFEQESS